HLLVEIVSARVHLRAVALGVGMGDVATARAEHHRRAGGQPQHAEAGAGGVHQGVDATRVGGFVAPALPREREATLGGWKRSTEKRARLKSPPHPGWGIVA